MLVYSGDWTFLKAFAGSGGGPGLLQWPSGMAPGPTGEIFITQRYVSPGLQVYDSDGNYLRSFTSTETQPGYGWSPAALAVGVNGLIHVVEDRLNRIQVFDPNGTPVRSFGDPIIFGDAPVLSAIGLDGFGDVYVSDAASGSIFAFNPDGKYIGKFGGDPDDPSRLTAPTAMAVDREGHIFLMQGQDPNNQYVHADKLRKLSPTGVLLGDYGEYGSTEGRFAAASGLTLLDPSTLLVADTGNDRLQKLRISFPEDYAALADAAIDAPRPLQILNGRAALVVGTATGPAFQGYILKVGEISSPEQVLPDSWMVVAQSPLPVVQGVLGSLDLEALTGRYYRLRLEAADGQAGVLVAETVFQIDRVSPVAQITNPANGGLLTDLTEIVGTAADPNLKSYKLEYGKPDAPDSWVTIFQGEVSHTNETLANWTTVGVAPGIYALRLSVEDYGGNSTVDQVTVSKGDVQWIYTLVGVIQGDFTNVIDVEVGPAPQRLVYVLDRDKNLVQIYNQGWQLVGYFGGAGAGQGRFNNPEALAVSASGTVYVADTGNHRIQVLSASGDYQDEFGTQGSGPGQLLFPAGIAFGPNGLLHVSDRDNNRVQVFTAAGEFVEQFGAPGVAEGQFNKPTALDADRFGNLFVLDTDNQRIQLLDAQRELMHVVDSAAASGDLFTYPRGVATDPWGNLYASDSWNYNGYTGDPQCVTKANADGAALLKIGESPGSTHGKFLQPRGVDADDRSRLYVCDSANRRVEIFDVHYPAPSAGSPTVSFQYPASGGVYQRRLPVVGTAAGPGFTGYRLLYRAENAAAFAPFQTGTLETVRGTLGVFDVKAVSAGRYVVRLEADFAGETLGVERTIVVDRANPVAKIAFPHATDVVSGLVAVTGTASDENFDAYILDYGRDGAWEQIARGTEPKNGAGEALAAWDTSLLPDDVYQLRLRVFDRAGKQSTDQIVVSKGLVRYVGSFGGGQGALPGQLTSPNDVAAGHSGQVYVADTGNHRVQVFDGAGTYLHAFGGPGENPDDMSSPQGLAKDATDFIHVADTNHHRYQVFSPEGALRFARGGSGSAAGRFASPRGIFVDSGGRIFVADTNNQRVQVFDHNGLFLRFIGEASGTPGKLTRPVALTKDRFGTLYVLDANTVKVYGGDETFLYSFTNPAWNSWPSPEVQDIVADANDNLIVSLYSTAAYSAAQNVHKIERYTADGRLRLTFGGVEGSAPGRFSRPAGLDVDDDGILYVADKNNHRVQKLALAPTHNELAAPVARLDFPVEEQWKKNSFPVVGAADATSLDAYYLDCRLGSAQSAWQPIRDISAVTPEGMLGLFDARGVQDGTYTIRLRVEDLNGDYAADEVTIHLDQTAPQAAIASPAEDKILEDAMPISGTAWDANIARFVLEYRAVGAQSWTEIASATGVARQNELLATWHTQTLLAGNYELRLRVTDLAGNESSLTRSVVKGELQVLATIGQYGSGTGQFSNPYDVALAADGTILVADYDNRRVQVLDGQGAFLRNLGGSVTLSRPYAVHAARDGKIHVADYFNNRVRTYTAAGNYQKDLNPTEYLYPLDIAEDAAGNLFLGLGSSQKQVRRYTADGSLIQSYAGFTLPSGVASDRFGMLYVADRSSHRISALNPAGEILWTYGTGAAGSGPGMLSYPVGVAVDRSGNLVVVDSGNNRLVRLSAGGTFLKSYGGNGSTPGKFSWPRGIWCDAQGDLYVADTGNHRIQKLRIFEATPPGLVAQIASPASGSVLVKPAMIVGTAFSPEFSEYLLDAASGTAPHEGDFTTPLHGDRAVVSGTLGYLDTSTLTGDVYTLRLRVFDTLGNVEESRVTFFMDRVPPTVSITYPAPNQILGEGLFSITGTADDAFFDRYVLDYGTLPDLNSFKVIGQGTQPVRGGELGVWNTSLVDPGIYTLRLRAWDKAGNWNEKYFTVSKGEIGLLATIGGPSGTGDGQFKYPYDVAADGRGRVFVVDRYNSRVQYFDLAGNFLGKFGGYGTGNGKFINPSGIGIDGSDRVYIADTGNNRVVVLDADLNLKASLSYPSTSPAYLPGPSDCAVSPAGVLYVVTSQNQVKYFSFDAGAGTYTYAGAFGTGSAGDAVDQLSSPVGVSVDRHGIVYVTDSGNSRVQVFSPTGLYLTWFGTAGTAPEQVGNLRRPCSDAAGNLLVPDQKVLPGVNLQRIAWFSGSGAFLRGFGATGALPGQFNAPEGVDVDPDGHLWVADTNNHRVQKFDIPSALPAETHVEIGSPATGFYANGGGLVMIGTAAGASFASYELAYGSGVAPEEWTVIGAFDRPVINGTLGYWEFPVADGAYTLRLTVTETGGIDLPPVFATVEVDRAAPEAFIGYPADWQMLGSVESVQGRVEDAHLANWTLEYGLSATPTSFVTIAGGVAPGIDGDLALWNTQGISNGVYTLRLTARDRAGNRTVHARVISIGPVAYAGRIGTGVDGTASNQVSYPQDVARGPDGRIYVAESGANRIKVFNPDGSFVGAVGRDTGEWTHDLYVPYAVAVDSQSTIYAADSRNVVQIYRYRPATDDWAWSGTLGEGGTELGQFDYPTDIAVMEQAGQARRLYIVDSNNHRVQVLDRASGIWAPIGSYGADYGQFINPRGIALDGYGNLYVTDAGNNRVVIFDAQGNYLSHFGQSGQIIVPWGIAVDAVGNLYVTQQGGTYGILKFNADGTLLLSFAPSGTSEGQLAGAAGLCVATDNTVFAAGSSNHTVEIFRVFSPPGVASSAAAYMQSPLDGVVTNRDLLVVGAASGPQFFAYALSYGPGLNPAQNQMTVITAADRSINKGTLGYWNTGGLADGAYTLLLEVTDQQNSVVADRATVFIDRIVPVAQITAPSNLDRVSGVIRIQGTASDNHLAYYRLEYGFANDDTSWVTVARVDGTSVSGGTLAEWNLADVPNGVYTLRLFVEDLAGNRASSSVLVSKGPAQYLGAFGGFGTSNGEFNGPKALARGPDGRLYVLDAGNGRLQVFDEAGGFLGAFGTVGAGTGEFLDPAGLTIAPDGRIFVVDTGNHRVQVFAADWTHLATFGREGSGPGEFISPAAVALGAAGTIYVSDTFNNRVQYFTPEYAFSGTFGVFGSEPGDLYHPGGLACDVFGNVYVADTGNDRVEIFDGRGGFIAQFGNSGTPEQLLMGPLAVALDDDGNVYVASTRESTIKKYRADGVFQIGFGRYGSATGQLFEPAGLSVRGGGGSVEISVADTRNHRVQQFRIHHPTVLGVALAQILAPADGGYLRQRTLFVGTAYAPAFSRYAVWLDDGLGTWREVFSSDRPVLEGTLWYLDASEVSGASCRVKLRVSLNDGTYFESPAIHLELDKDPPQAGLTSPEPFSLVNGAVAVEGWANDAQFERYLLEYGNWLDDASWRLIESGTQPVFGGRLGIWDTTEIPDGTYAIRLTALDRSGNTSRTQMIVSKGYVRYLTTFGIYGHGASEMASPRDVATSPTGEIYALDSENHRVQVFDANRQFLRTFGGQGAGAGQLQGPGGIAVDPQGNVVVADTGNNRVLVFDPQGAVVRSIGDGGGLFNAPEGVAVDGAGTIYVADANNNCVRVLDATGATLRSLGYLYHPTGVAVDSSGKVFVAEPYSHRVTIFHADGTLWKSFGTYGAGPENLHNPWDVAVDVLDNVFVVDKNNNRIKKYATNGSVLTLYGSGGIGEGRFSSPMGVGVDAHGRVYVADTGNHRIQVLDDYGAGSDHQPPALWLDPTLVANLQGITVDVVGSVLDDNLARYTLGYRRTGEHGDWIELAHGSQPIDHGSITIWNTVGLEGLYTVRLWAVDKVLLEAELLLDLRVDAVAPAPPLFDPLPPITNQRILEIAGSAEASSRVDLRINGGPAGAVFADAAGRFVFRSAALPFEGQNVLVATATDAAGNRGEVGSALVERDTIAPAINISGVVEGRCYQVAVTPVVQVSDKNLLGGMTSVTLDGEPFASGTMIGADGDHRLSVTAADAAGNLAALQVGFAIDRMAPAWVSTVGAQFASPGNGAAWVYWNDAVDRHGPVRWNVYYGTSLPLDFATAAKLADVQPESGGFFAWAYRVDGLDNAGTYFFAVRAEDRMEQPNEDANAVTAQVTPHPVATFRRQAWGSASNGLSVTDLDNDGSLEVLLATDRGLTIWARDAQGDWADTTATWGAFPVERALAVLAADLDNDGDQEVVLAGESLRLYRNDGAGHLVDATAGSGLANPGGAVSVGVNGVSVGSDGLLDLLVSFEANGEGRFFAVYHNLGDINGDGAADLVFADETAQTGLSRAGEIRSVAAGNLNGGGAMDLLLAGGDANELFFNDGTGHYTDVTSANLPAINSDILGTLSADLDRDGDLDLFLANRGEHSYLFLNDGTGRFVDASSGLHGLVGTETGTNAAAGDFDHDGDPDLFLSLGSLNLLFENQGDGSFVEISAEAGVRAGSGETAVSADLDGDGDLDIVTSGGDLYENLRNDGSWLKVRLVGTLTNADAVGSRVWVYRAGHLGDPVALEGFAALTAGTGYRSQAPRDLHFGLDPSALYDVRAVFASGIAVEARGVSAGRLIVLVEDNTPPATADDYADSGVWRNQGAVIRLSATDDISGVAQTSFRVDGRESAYVGPIAIDDEGAHLLEYWSVDAAKNEEAPHAIEVLIDTTAPLTGHDFPSDDVWVGAAVTVHLLPDDSRPGILSSGVKHTSSSVNGALPGEDLLTLQFAADGVYALRFWSEDVAGNEEIPQLITIKIDTTPPAVEAGDDLNVFAQIDGTREVVLHAIVTDGTGFDPAPIISWWEGGTQLGATAELTRTFSLGNHDLTLKAVDRLGNTGTDTVRVKVMPRQTELVYTGQATADWSDSALLAVTVNDVTGGSAPRPLADWGRVTFRILKNGLPLRSYVFGGTDAAGTARVVHCFVDGAEPAGAYRVLVEFDDPAGIFASNGIEVPFTLQPEYGVLEYTGDRLVTINAANVSLQATLYQQEDETAGQSIGFSSDANVVRVRFDLYRFNQTPGPGVTPVFRLEGVRAFASALHPSVGVAAATIPLSALGAAEENYTVVVSLEDERYIAASPDEGTLTVYNPVGSFFTGGGFILDPANGEHNNFGFTFKFKNNKFQGNLVHILRNEQGGTKARIKSNMLVAVGYPPGDPPGTPTALAQGKCNVEVRDLWTELYLSGQGNLNFTLTVEDRGTPGLGQDTFHLEVRFPDGVPYAPAHMTHKELLQGGNIVIQQ